MVKVEWIKLDRKWFYINNIYRFGYFYFARLNNDRLLL